MQRFEFEKDGIVKITYDKEDTIEGMYYQYDDNIKIEVYGYFFESMNIMV